MQTTWEDNDSNGSESDNEKAILCLMANRDEVNSNYDSSSECEMSYDDLVDAYNGLLDAFKKLHDKLGKMVKKCASQRREKLIIESKFQTLLNENEGLKKEYTLLKETGSPELIFENASLKLISEDQIDGLAKFTQGTKNLELMLGAQRSVFYKNGLGYDPFDKKDCFKISTSSKDKWFLDSGCSRHIMGDRTKFSSLQAYKGGSVTFGDNSKGKDNLGKFDAKSDEGIFLGYSSISKAYRVYNKKTLLVVESIHVVFDESPTSPTKSVMDNDEEVELEKGTNELNTNRCLIELEKGINDLNINKSSIDIYQSSNLSDDTSQHKTTPNEWKLVHNYPIDQVIGDPSKGVSTRSQLRNICNFVTFVSQFEPKNIHEAENDESWLLAIQEELIQFKRNKV
ncbi:uncharacterized protein LOC132275215 [Cornus florida]|uniref:uncharacterized protein LOC132275215 n=1 Tax=Cornus florida TaxID=4283 RepID=UPI00289EF8B6|nr:uncharacterized protein LOC132275215 [Cornus florida]